MLKNLQSKKGFTIIEIMVVIALIGILALVLVPKFGGIKDRAKVAGVVTNVKTVEAYAASIIHEAGTANDLRDKIINYFNTNTLENPFTNGSTVDGGTGTLGTDGAVSGLNGENDALIVLTSTTSPAGAPINPYGGDNLKGCVVASIYRPANQNLTVTIVGFDNSGTPSIVSTKTIVK